MSAKEKPVVVRVKRKQFQEPLDAFWLEINERPLKRPLLDFGSLSISDSAGNGSIDDAKCKKVFVQRIETLSSSKVTKDILESFLSDSADTDANRKKIEERRHMHKQDNERGHHLRSVAIQNHEDSARNARFEQIWKSRKANGQQKDNMLHEICHLYDVVRVDPENRSHCVVKESMINNTDDNELSKYLPLLKEFLPAAATEIESDLRHDNYVYDIYTIEDDTNMSDEGPSREYPLVQVDNADDYYDDPSESEYDSEDSNAENSDLHDYPDEESSEDDEKSEVEEFATEDEFDDPGDSYDEYDKEFTNMTEEEKIVLKWRYC